MEEATVICSASAVDHLTYNKRRLKATAVPCMRYISFGKLSRNLALSVIHVKRILRNEWGPLYSYPVEEHPI